MKCFESEHKDGKQGDVVGPEYMLRGRRGVGIHDRRDAFYIIFPHTIENAQTCCITLCSKSNSHIASEIVLSFARVRLKSAKSREHLKRRLHHQEKTKRTKPLSRFQMLIMTTSSSQTKTTILSKSLVIPLPSCDISTARI